MVANMSMTINEVLDGLQFAVHEAASAIAIEDSAFKTPRELLEEIRTKDQPLHTALIVFFLAQKRWFIQSCVLEDFGGAQDTQEQAELLAKRTDKDVKRKKLVEEIKRRKQQRTGA